MWCIETMITFGIIFFFFKQKTAYEMRISDWSSDVCSSDLDFAGLGRDQRNLAVRHGRRMAAIDERGIEPGDGVRHRGRVVCNLQQQIGRASCRESVCQYV